MPAPLVALATRRSPSGRALVLARAVATIIGELCPGLPLVVMDLAGDDDASTVGAIVLAAALVIAVADGSQTFLTGLAPGALRGLVAIPAAIDADPDRGLRGELVRLGASVPTASLRVDPADLDRPDRVITPWLEEHGRLLWPTLRQGLATP